MEDELVQPSINIGLLGSVSNGKSSIVSMLTGTKTQRHSSEKKQNITIKLGYANAKIFKCSECERPQCYQSFSSDVKQANCSKCRKKMDLVKHVSFVDCQGHSGLMNTMLNGTCIMDCAIIVEAGNNKEIPSQTVKHYTASKILGLDINFACMNKLDLIEWDVAEKRIQNFKKFLDIDIPIIPIAANLGLNKDIICEYLCTKIKDPNRDDDNKSATMVIIRSFNINKQNTDIKNMAGGVIGGSLINGQINIGDKIEILPGIVSCINNKWVTKPLKSKIVSINSDKNKLEVGKPGGLLGVQLKIDPALTAKDKLVGNIMRVVNDNMINKYKIYGTLYIFLELIGEEKLKKKSEIIINHNACNIKCRVIRVKKDRAEILLLDKPICIMDGDYVTISKNTFNGLCFIGRGKIAEGKL
jgi:translation initiation factor 2 subunit 3